jgi:hypothetical protein
LSTPERVKYRQNAPGVRDELIDTVLQFLLDEMTPDLLRLVKQESAAREYAGKKHLRLEEIDRWSNKIFEKMREEVVEDLVRQVLGIELRKRFLVRKVGKMWKDWARKEREAREESLRVREETFERLKGLGLSASVSGSLTDARDGTGDEERMDEFQVDVALKQVGFMIVQTGTAGANNMLRLSGPRITFILLQHSLLP